MKFDSPAESLVFKRLADFVKSSQDKKTPDVKSLSQFLWLINAHPDLLAFGLVCKNLYKILQIMNDLNCTCDHDFDYLQPWSDISNWIHRHEENLGRYVEDNITLRPHLEDEHPLSHKGLGRHCLYAVLCNDHRDEILREKYSYLVGLYVFAYSKTMKEFNQQEIWWKYNSQSHIAFPNSPYNASLALRLFSTVSSSFVKNIPLGTSPENLLFYCADCCDELREDNKDEKILGKKIKHYANYLAKAFGVKRWRRRKSSSIRRKKGGSVNRARIPGYLITQDSDDLGEGEATISSIQESLGKPTKAVKEGLHPEEKNGDGDTLVFVGVPCTRAKKGSGRTAFAALGYARHTAMRHQVLPWQQNQLTMTQLCSLLKYCKEEFESLLSKEIWHKDDFFAAELISLIHIMLWTSSSVKQGIKICLSDNDKDVGVLILRKNQNSNVPEWVMPAYKPDYATEVDEDEVFVCTRGEYIVLPDVRRGSFFVLETDKKKLKPLFRSDPKRYEQHLQDMLLKIAPNMKPIQLEKFLFNSICNFTGDIALACEVTNRKHPLAGVRAFYSTVSLKYVQNIYSRVVSSVADAVYKEMGSSFTPQSYNEDGKDYNVGARHLPNKDAVKNAVGQIRKLIEPVFHAGITDLKKFVDYHNYYTLYTVLFFSYATSCRAIISPYIPSRNINVQRGVAALADKDGKEGNKSRLVWLPDQLITQINNYEKHCEAILFQWDDLKNRVAQKGYDCFFINYKKRCEAVMPKLIGKYLKNFLPLPVNSNRKFMRMGLLAKGCPQEIVDAFMGHWFYGEEPWGVFSSLSYADYVAKLKIYLTPILEDEIGFKPVRSSLFKCI